MTGTKIPMSVFEPPSDGEAYLEYLRRPDVQTVQCVIVAETRSPEGSEITITRESGTEEDARSLLRRALERGS